MRRLIYLSSAHDDLSDILRYITRESASLAAGKEFVDKLKQRCDRLATLPGTHGTARPELRDDLRSTSCQGYVIFFRYRPECLEIVNIVHGSRDIITYFDEP